jgi:hypothetical protein
MGGESHGGAAGKMVVLVAELNLVMTQRNPLEPAKIKRLFYFKL